MTSVFSPGDTFQGYSIVRMLGEGGLGSVYLAADSRTGAEVAVKILDRDIAKSKREYVQRFMREANLASNIRHPNLVAVYESGHDDALDVYYIVMEYAEGVTLRSAISMGGPLPPAEAAGVVLQMAGVLDAAEKYGLVHRDLKPENVMVAPGGRVKLLDLGVAKVSRTVDSLHTVAASVFGTPAYIAPEQALDSSTVDCRADIYSLGIILFEMLAGKRPYEGGTPVEALKILLNPAPLPDVRTEAPDVPAALAELVAKMCAKRPADRFANPRELIEAFRREGYGAVDAKSAAPAAADKGESMEKILGRCGGADGGKTLTSISLEAGDPEIRDFLVRRQRAKKLRTAVKIAAGAAAAVGAAAALAVKLLVLAVAVALPAYCAESRSARVADCVRNPTADKTAWASADVEYAKEVMADVFAAAGVETSSVPFGKDNLFNPDETDVICSTFITPQLAKKYSFPKQPLGRMHFALYTTKARAKTMLSHKITNMPQMRVGHTPVAQGQGNDRENYFDHATLTPEYVEYPTGDAAIKALENGEIDLVFLYTPFGMRPEGLEEIIPIGSRNLYFAVRKDRPELFTRLSTAYRKCYIENIERYDELRERLLGIPKPADRVRVAAYERGHLFKVKESGERTGILEEWFTAIAARTHWTLDYVYGDYEESVADVAAGRLDIAGGIGFTGARSEQLLFSHTPIGMQHAYLWVRPDSRFLESDPSTWEGIRVGVLRGTRSAERVKEHLAATGNTDMQLVEFRDDAALKRAYFSKRLDACIDIETPELDNEKALHIYASHPMYMCVTPGKRELFLALERALYDICDDFSRYMRMITERHYGKRSEWSMLSFREMEWLTERLKDPTPVMINFSPWPVALRGKDGNIQFFAARLMSELEKRTGLNFDAEPQTGIQTAEARFLRGDTQLWFPYPERVDVASMGGTSVFSVPVPKAYASYIGADSRNDELELWANRDVPDELRSILRKVVASIDSEEMMQDMFIKAVEEHAPRVFGMTNKDFERLMETAGLVTLAVVAVFAVLFALYLRRQARIATAAAKSAREYSNAKTRFLAMMSHELRTPLNAVIGFAEFLARSDCDEKCRREYVDGIQVSAHTLLDLINDILDLSKLDSGAMHMLTGECDVAKIASELPTIFGGMLMKSGTELVVRRACGATPPVLRISHPGMKQILINLVGNAAKFTERGRIVVEYGWIPERGALTLAVSDTGCGISDEKLARMFDPFVQDIKSRIMQTNTKRGTGLGLPIVKRIVDNAGGKINVSTELGKGTRFDIEIPNLEPIRPSEIRDDGSVRRAPERVLVVDDIEINRKVLGIHLRNLGVSDIRFADNGKSAMDAMKSWTPEIVLTDMWMPEMDGQQLAAAIRADRTLDAVRIVAITADIDVASTYDMSLFEKILAKPVTGDKLQELFV